MTALATYEVGNNTDYSDNPLRTNSRRVAERCWRQIRPRPGAGNRYRAWFRRQCACGAMVDALQIGAHCARDAEVRS